jgi:hypothetical protein
MYDNLILGIHTMSIWFWPYKPGVTGLVLLHLLSGADGDVITIRSCWNVIMFKIMARPRGPMRQWHEG